MPLQPLKLDIPEATLPADVADFLDEANLRIEDFIAERRVRISGFVPSDFDRVYAALEAVSDQRFATGDVFCEWGSGFGVVAMLAAALEFQAYGIEIEQSLVDGARQLAEDFDLPVDFIVGSFVPHGGEHIAEQLDTGEYAWLSTHADSAYAQLGMAPGDFDVIYAFPWPGEEDIILSLFEEFASVGALLLTFGQIEGVQVRRKVVRA